MAQPLIEGGPFQVDDALTERAETTMMEKVGQDAPPCVVGDDGEVVVVVLRYRHEGGGALAQRIAALLNGEPT